MAEITIEVIQDIPGGQIFADLIKAANDLSPAMSDVEKILIDSTDRNFAREQSPTGQQWVELAILTQKQREKRGFGPTSPILKQTGSLFNSIVSSHGNDFAEIGSDNPYGIFHMTGTSKMPARIWLGLSDQDEQDVINVFDKYLTV